MWAGFDKAEIKRICEKSPLVEFSDVVLKQDPAGRKGAEDAVRYTTGAQVVSPLLNREIVLYSLDRMFKTGAPLYYGAAQIPFHDPETDEKLGSISRQSFDTAVRSGRIDGLDTTMSVSKLMAAYYPDYHWVGHKERFAYLNKDNVTESLRDVFKRSTHKTHGLYSISIADQQAGKIEIIENTVLDYALKNRWVQGYNDATSIDEQLSLIEADEIERGEQNFPDHRIA